MATHAPARTSLAAFAAALALGATPVAGCGGDDESDEAATAPEAATDTAPAETAPAAGEAERSADAQIVDFSYDPDPITVKAGGTVTWANEDTAAHTASSDEETPAEFDSDTIEQGKSGEAKLDAPGTYAYHCDFHATMHGTIEVVE